MRTPLALTLTCCVAAGFIIGLPVGRAQVGEEAAQPRAAVTLLHSPTSEATTEREENVRMGDRFSGASVYVADLGAYNAGVLRGKWFMPAEYGSAEDFAEAVQEYIAERPGAEEWAIHDYERFGSIKPGEYADLDEVWLHATMIEEHGEAWSDYITDVDPGDPSEEDFEDHFRGQWGSGAEFAAEMIEECYNDSIIALPDFLRYRIDWDGVWHDMRLSGEFSISDSGNVFAHY